MLIICCNIRHLGKWRWFWYLRGELAFRRVIPNGCFSPNLVFTSPTFRRLKLIVSVEYQYCKHLDGRCILYNYQKSFNGMLDTKNMGPKTWFGNCSCKARVRSQSMLCNLWLQHETGENGDSRFILYNNHTVIVLLSSLTLQTLVQALNLFCLVHNWLKYNKITKIR